MANLYRSRDGLSARATATPHEVQLRIDPILYADHLDHQISSLHAQVSLLKYVTWPKKSRWKAAIQNDIISDLKSLMASAQEGMKNGMRRLNRTMAQQRSNHVYQVVTFGLVCFLMVYLWSKLFRT
ncbi:hypothetical protein Tsubulata_007499 [Turnera subulata]|uniref:t-SNARE coiled-coil homology domain-containing protein n=1 Tax=Turnera subulata TaxID=218843 RepID=A0A9Q0FZ44_9ROSI|nr:hypothetical protein Tsubulata_007499 [Turnera subulata]